MTRAMLLSNVVDVAEQRLGIPAGVPGHGRFSDGTA
jgi:hypothetical protein